VHAVIEWEVEGAWQEEVDHERVVLWKLVAMTEKVAETPEKLSTEIINE